MSLVSIKKWRVVSPVARALIVYPDHKEPLERWLKVFPKCQSQKYVICVQTLGIGSGPPGWRAVRCCVCRICHDLVEKVKFVLQTNPQRQLVSRFTNSTRHLFD